jgi:hypothetical protein
MLLCFDAGRYINGLSHPLMLDRATKESGAA